MMAELTRQSATPARIDPYQASLNPAVYGLNFVRGDCGSPSLAVVGD
jgi:hypothetical protein